MNVLLKAISNGLKDTVFRNLLSFLIILSLSRKLTSIPDVEENQHKFGNVYVSSEITTLPEKLCYIWTATRDVVLRKCNLPKFHRYGLDFQINRNNASTLICILLCGDVESNPGPSQRINCATLNARSLKSLHNTDRGDKVSNINCFQDFTYTNDLDVICVNETWLNGNISNGELLHDDYIIYRKDRDTRRAGGVLIAVKICSFMSVKQYLPDTINTSEDLEQLEIVAAELTTCQHQQILFCSCYRPPDSGSIWLDTFNIYLNQACDRFDKVVISGDFNLPNISWNHDNTIKTPHASVHPFIEALNDHYLTQMNHFPTRENNILDLIITSAPEHVNITEIESPENAAIFTDHCLIHYEFNESVKVPTKSHRYTYDYRNGDFKGLRSTLSAKNMCLNLEHDDINDDWQHWKDTFLNAVSTHIPRKKIKGRNPLPWINGAILNLINKKNTIRKKLRSSPTIYLTQKFKNLRATIKHMLRESREQFFISLGNDFDCNPKRLWSILKLKSKSRNIPDIISSATTTRINQKIHSSRTTADKPVEIANMFNNYFASVFTSDKYVNEASEYDQVGDVETELTLTVKEVQTLLENLDSTKATGPDNIPARLLKETASVISPSLCMLFNKSLNQGVLPQEWKLANVVPVHKKGERDHTENYRPISLLPIVSKILERCVFCNIKDHLFQIIHKSQHGFRSGKSCVTNLLEVLNFVGSELDAGGQIDAIYLDMSKAFDKVDHKHMLHKLRMAGIGGNLLQWFQSYLTNRSQRVTVLGATSESLPVTSGVPQGSILGPVLFSLYVNDLPDTVTSSQVAMFADDTKLFTNIRSVDDCERLQRDLDNLRTWSSESGLLFNETKCKAQRITRKIKPITTTYKLNTLNLKKTENERDLGVWVASNLTWNRQTNEQTAKANKLLGYIRRSTLYIHNTSVRRTLYLALVRPQLGYATQIWAPQSIELIKQIERTQRRATKFILELPFSCDIDYTTRLQTLSLLPICYWHEYLDMVLFYKITHGLVKIESSILPTIRTPRQTRSSNSTSTKFFIPKYRTTTHQKSFIIRSTRIWNLLVDKIKMDTDSLSTFKAITFNYYISSLKTCYDVDDARSYKTICLKCNSVRSLMSPISCCM